jgi:type IV fimbrial biogenesis protein FimT
MQTTQRGFTLIELMTALLVLALLVGLATPSFKQFSANSRTVATTNSLVNALAVARSEALRRSMPVTACASINSTTCTASTNWSTGWIVFTDNTGTAGVLDGTDLLLEAWPGVAPILTVNSSVQSIQYNARGMTNLAAAVTFTTWSPGCSGPNRTQIVVTVAGSPQNTHIACP